MDDTRTFGELIREEREKRKVGNPDFSLRKFAVRVGISPTFLSKVETGEFDPPKAEKVMKIADELGLDRNMLLAKAQKIDPELKRIVTQKQAELASFLRTADGMSEEQLRKMAEVAEKIKAEGNDGISEA